MRLPIKYVLALLLAVLLLAGCTLEPPGETTGAATLPGPAKDTSWGEIYSISSAVCRTADGKMNWRIGCSYDAWGNLIRVTQHDSHASLAQTDVYSYDTLGRIRTMTVGGDLDIIRCSYSVSGNLIAKEQGIQRTEYAYDRSGRLVVENQYNSGILNRHTTYSYSNTGRLILAQTYDSDGDATRSYRFLYSQEGRLSQMRYFSGTGTLPQVVECSYDDQGNLESQSMKDRSGEYVGKVCYGYDGGGHCLTITRFDEDDQVLWWIELNYRSVRVPEENLDQAREARDRIVPLRKIAAWEDEELMTELKIIH